jgi:hypothetical protein
MPTDTLRVSPDREQSVKPASATTSEAPLAQTSGMASLRTPRFAVEVVLFLMLAVGGSLLLWGSTFVNNMVHDQLRAQKIFFPDKGSDALDPATFPGLQRYAGQAVDNGPKAKAYANEFIAVHVTHIADGKTYAEVSTAAQQRPDDPVLAAQADSLFRGETLRGLLLSVWGWSVVALIASITSIAALAAAGVVLLSASYTFLRTGDPR